MNPKSHPENSTRLVAVNVVQSVQQLLHHLLYLSQAKLNIYV